MPVYKLLKEMPYEELIGWFEYFKKRPVEWRDDNRTALLMQAQGVKEKPERIFPSLRAIKDIDDDKKTAQTLKSSGLLAKLQAAAVNNNIDWKVD
jgi:hypothetical protein